MKLYAKIQGEKLTDGKISWVKKGQGSNTRLDINIMNEAGALLAYVTVSEREGDLPVVYFTHLKHHAYLATSDIEHDAILKIEKGKKQKTA